MTQAALQELYNRKYRNEDWHPLHLRPSAVSTTRYDDLARLIAEERGSLLDIGCGAGQVVLALADQFENLVGIDFAEVRVELAQHMLAERFAKHKHKVRFAISDSEQTLGFPDASFDVVVALAVLEHVVDPFHFMDEVARVCKPGGCVVLQVPNIAYIRHVLGLFLGRIPLTGTPTRDIETWRRDGWDSGHLHYFTRGALDALLRHTGFVPEAWSGSGALARLRRWWPLLTGDLTVRARRRPGG